jgi:hypothetical protein
VWKRLRETKKSNFAIRPVGLIWRSTLQFDVASITLVSDAIGCTSAIPNCGFDSDSQPTRLAAILNSQAAVKDSAAYRNPLTPGLRPNTIHRTTEIPPISKPHRPGRAQTPGGAVGFLATPYLSKSCLMYSPRMRQKYLLDSAFQRHLVSWPVSEFETGSAIPLLPQAWSAIHQTDGPSRVDPKMPELAKLALTIAHFKKCATSSKTLGMRAFTESRTNSASTSS